ncbi:MAG TPA: hypothetical protein IAA51_02420 [Candidatus Cottocaccamicrobium excrementipullorum]|nr:hypothetical protein [Candidatus Cottocaccamicrobium excrementipullorum]
MILSAAIKECADIAILRYPEAKSAYEIFWDEFKNRIGQIPSTELAACMRAGLFNMNKNCFELTLLIPFPQEMLDSGIRDEVAEYGRQADNGG